MASRRSRVRTPPAPPLHGLWIKRAKSFHQEKSGMSRVLKRATAEKFNKLDFHDDALVSVKIRAPRTRKNLTGIDFQFRDDGTKAIKPLSFQSCANLRFVMDFDALAYTWFFGVEGSIAKTDVQRMKKFVRSQMSHWRTAYMPPMSKDQPIRKKLKSIGSYILFQVRFFGGTAEVLAKNYKLKR